MEMQEQDDINDTVYDEVHEVENPNEQQDYNGPITRSRAKAQEYIETLNQDEKVFEEGLPILIHIETFVDSEEIDSDMEEEQEYKGPVTRARAKTVEQTNTIMA